MIARPGVEDAAVAADEARADDDVIDVHLEHVPPRAVDALLVVPARRADGRHALKAMRGEVREREPGRVLVEVAGDDRRQPRRERRDVRRDLFLTHGWGRDEALEP